MKSSNPRSKKQDVQSIAAVAAAADEIKYPEMEDLGDSDDSEIPAVAGNEGREGEGASPEDESWNVHVPEELSVREGEEGRNRESEDEKVVEVENVVRNSMEEVEEFEKRDEVAVSTLADVEAKGVIVEGERNLGSFMEENSCLNAGDAAEMGKERGKEFAMSPVEGEEEGKEETIEKEINLGPIMGDDSILNAEEDAAEKSVFSGEESRQEVVMTSSNVVEVDAKGGVIEEDKNLDSITQDNLILNAEEAVKKGASTSEEQGEVKQGYTEGEGVGGGGDDGPQMDVETGAEENSVEKVTSVVEMEGKTEVEEMEPLEHHNDNAGANEVDGVVRVGVQVRDDEEVNAEDNEKLIEEGSDGYSEENDEFCAYFHVPVTDSKKQKNIEIFVGGLDKGVVEEDLINIFGKFGEIKSIRIVTHPTRRKSKGFAFIRYATFEQANNVLSELKDGIEVKGKHVNISASQDNDTLYMGNICYTWTKEHVLEALRGYEIENVEDIYLPEDPKRDGKIKGFAHLEFSTHSDAVAAFQRLRKPDAVFGRSRSAKVAFARNPMHPIDEAVSKVKTVYVEGLTESWDDKKVEEICKQYGEIEKVKLSSDLGTKRKDFGFVTFTSRESALACVEGINNAEIVDGKVKVKADIAKLRFRGQPHKQGTRGGFRINEEGGRIVEAVSSKRKGCAKSIEAERNEKSEVNKKGKALPSSKYVGGETNEAKNISEGNDVGAPYKQEKENRKRKASLVDGRGKEDKNHDFCKRPKKKPEGNIRGGKNIRGKSNEAISISEGDDVGASYKQKKENRKRKSMPSKVDGHGREDKYHGFIKKSKKKPQGNMRSWQNVAFRNQRSDPRFREGPTTVASSVSYGNQYALGYAPLKSSLHRHSHNAVSGSATHRADMEPHAGFLEPGAGQRGQTYAGYHGPTLRIQGQPHAEYFKPAVGVQGHNLYDYGMTSAGGCSGPGSSGASYRRVGSAHLPPYAESYTRRAVYKGGRPGEGSGGHRYSSSLPYGPGRA